MVKTVIEPSDALLSPKDLAVTIGVSESSVRRWIDNGDIRISRTAGGHRRLPLSEAVQFIRRMGAVVVRPDVLNFPAVAPVDANQGSDADERLLLAALQDGRRDVARGLVLSWYLRGQSLDEIFERVDGRLQQVVPMS